MDATPNAARLARNTFLIAAIGGYITTLDLSIVNVAFAEIAKTYSSASRSDIAWVVTAYNIMFGSLLVAGGKTADLLGRKRVFLAGATVFGIGSALCGLAPSLATLVAGRALQGLGGAFLTPATLGLLLAAYPPDRRTQMVTMWGGVTALGVASGPTLGALLIAGFGWRSAFWLNVPIVLGVIIAGRAVLHESPRQTGTSRPDYFGASLITIALATLALGISQSEHWGWSDARTIACMLLAIALVPLFTTLQRRHPNPVLDLTLFDHRSFTVANLASLCFGFAFAAMFLNNVLFLRTLWHYSVLEAGFASCIAPITVAVVSPRAGKLASRRGFRLLLIVGPLFYAASVIANATLLSTRPSIALWLISGVVLGIGVGCTLPVLSSAAVSTLEPHRFAVGGAVNNTFRQIGAVLGVAILVAVLGHPKSSAQSLTSFRRGWWLGAALAIAATLISTQQPRRPHPRNS